jgi:hypothetical protein
MWALHGVFAVLERQTGRGLGNAMKRYVDDDGWEHIFQIIFHQRGLTC